MPPLNLCCCCCANGLHRRRRQRHGAYIFSEEEDADLIKAADIFNRDTGRSCADFFKTMRLPGNPDRVIADRPTLLAKVTNLNQARAVFAATTICAQVAKLPKRPYLGGVIANWLGVSPASLPFSIGTTTIEEARIIGHNLFKAYGVAGRFQIRRPDTKAVIETI